MADLADYLVDGLDVEEHTAVFKATHNDVGGYQVPGRLVVVVEDRFCASTHVRKVIDELYVHHIIRIINIACFLNTILKFIRVQTAYPFIPSIAALPTDSVVSQHPSNKASNRRHSSLYSVDHPKAIRQKVIESATAALQNDNSANTAADFAPAITLVSSSPSSISSY